MYHHLLLRVRPQDILCEYVHRGCLDLIACLPEVCNNAVILLFIDPLDDSVYPFVGHSSLVATSSVFVYLRVSAMLLLFCNYTTKIQQIKSPGYRKSDRPTPSLMPIPCKTRSVFRNL